jgi:hypothetical protein
MHDREVDLVTMFFDLLHSLKLGSGGANKICWIRSKRQKFKVKSFYHHYHYIMDSLVYFMYIRVVTFNTFNEFELFIKKRFFYHLLCTSAGFLEEHLEN